MSEADLTYAQLPSSYPCEWCGADTETKEFVINFGICDPCFDASYELYIESVAGPYDWIEIHDTGT